MTQDEIIRMAVKCQLLTTSNRDGLYAQALEAFAELVAEKERESCAEICKKHADVYAGLGQNPTTKSAWAACIDNLDAIQARGQA